jgi:hypothetical protein
VLHKENTPKGRNHLSAKMQRIERQKVTNTATVSVMFKPSERKQIYHRIMDGLSSLAQEAIYHKSSRSLIVNVLRVERLHEISREREQAYLAGRRDSLIHIIQPPPPTSGPGGYAA